MIAESFISVRTTRDHPIVREWELVLLSQGLSPHVGESLDGFVLSVPEHELEAARAALAAYDRESPSEVAQPDEPAQPIDLFWGSLIALLMLAFYLVTNLKDPAVPWLARGSADAERILSGEFWRVVTALTLHANIGHVLSNAAAAAIFFSAVYSMVGTGLGSLLLLMAGAGGNLFNAWMRGSSHISVGASTVVFGAVGMLGVLSMLRRPRSVLAKRRAWLPVAAALALLAMLGTAGERVDIVAHLFGFISGAFLAALTSLAPRKPPLAVQWLCGAAALAALVYCWMRALP